MRPIVLNPRNRRLALAFAIGGNLVPIAIACLTDRGTHHWLFYAGAVGACLAPIGVVVIPRRHRVPFWLAAFGGIPALTALQSYTGGVASGYSVLLMMAMVWFGLQATERELLAGLAVLAASSIVPMLALGAPAYPVDWGHAILLVLVGSAVAGSLHTMTREMQRLTARLRREAVVDDLTGLLNRRGWRESTARRLEAGGPGGLLGTIAIDLDRFKELNDTLGHDTGDRVLTEIAGHLRTVAGAEHIAARLGGDEFVALFFGTSVDDLVQRVDLLRRLAGPRCPFSAGVALGHPGEDLDQLVRRADMALYEAKTSGGNGLAVAPHPVGVAA